MKKRIKDFLRKVGYEVSKYSPAHSTHALQKQIILQNQFDLIIDVGANSGQYGITLREIGYKGKIISFEPLPATYELLSENARKYQNWEIHNFAIGNQEGSIEINVSENTYSSSILSITDTHVNTIPESRYVAQESIRIKKLTDAISAEYLSRYSSILLKIDVQGFEMAVLEGASPLLPSIKMVQTELSFAPLYKHGPLYNDIFKKMEESGFEFFTLIPEFFDLKSGRLLQADGVFLNKLFR
jgi:FkbM family methyltransferase